MSATTLLRAAALVLACATLLAFAGSPQAPPVARQEAAPALTPASAPLCTVILVRHAEKDTAGDARDPQLSEAGKKRAAALARLLGKARVTHLFASEFQRTQATLAPLAAAAGIKVEVHGAAKPAELAAVLRKLPAQSVAVVAGHSNTLPGLASELGVKLGELDAKGYLEDAAYDRLFLITLPSEGSKLPASLLELRYGD